MSTDYAWAAGFFDGEGHTGAMHNTDRRQWPWYYSRSIRLNIEQVPDKICLGEEYSSLLDKFTLIFPQAHFKIHTITRNDNSNRSPITKLGLHRFSDIQDIMCRMWPWLGQVKKDQYTRAVKEYLRSKNETLVR